MPPLEVILKHYLFRLINAFRSGTQFSASQLPTRFFQTHPDRPSARPAWRSAHRYARCCGQCGGRFPNAYIAIVVREYTAPVVEHNPYVDEVIVFYEKLRRWNLRKLVQFWKSVRNGFDCVIVLNTISRSLSSDIIALLSGAKYIVGPGHLLLDPSRPERIYNVIVPRSSGRSMKSSAISISFARWVLTRTIWSTILF